MNPKAPPINATNMKRIIVVTTNVDSLTYRGVVEGPSVVL
jgi:hypothetical protein